MGPDLDALVQRSDELWETSILPSLSDFIEIHALSPLFEPNWAELGELDATIDLFCAWLDEQEIAGLSHEVHRIEDKSPVLLVTIEGTGPGEVIFYSHLDKQPSKPELWSEGLHPLKAVRRDPWLYGRGSVDDGYGGYLCVTSIRLLQEAGIPHPRCAFLIETCEESGSFDLPPYLDALSEELGDPDMIVVLDSGGPDYDHVWMTEALRGLVSGTLSVRVSHEGIHSGTSGGSIPSSFRIQRMLLDRVEDSSTGEVLIPEMHVEIDADIRDKAAALAEVVAAVDAEVVVVSYNDEAWIDRDDLVDLCRIRGEVCLLAFDSKRYVGAQIGIHSPSGERVGKVSHLRNQEYLVVAGERSLVRHMAARFAGNRVDVG